ncbi:MAG TPA: class I SAM-dependent methyltransferase [Baekduia sp.]|nr:class I SAM-dependent methyltransferase [Baekduia sp.]
MGSSPDMGAFWDERAREDAFFFVDDTQSYRAVDEARFWAEGERVVDVLLGHLGLALRGDEVALDIGCGLGRLTRALRPRVAHVHAIDVSAEMLRRAQQANAHLDGVTWHLGDGTTLQPVADASVDAILSHVVFQHIPDPEVTYGYVREMGRVLRPGGWAAFQVSDDPAVHAREHRGGGRLRALLGRAPKGQEDPRWRGSAVDLDRLRAAAREGDAEVARTWGEGTQFCLVRLEKPGP